jgi:hypothetical protein
VLSELPSGDSAKPAERWFVRRISPKPTSYLTGEDLYQIAAIKFEEAAVTPEGPARQQVLKSAYNFRDLAKMKGWPQNGVKAPE